MNLLTILDGAILDGMEEHGYLNALLVALVSILIVLGVLVVIIAITHFLFKGLNAVFAKIEAKKENKNLTKVEENTPKVPVKVEITDDDMMAAVLAATIDYQAEIKKDVRVISVKEIK